MKIGRAFARREALSLPCLCLRDNRPSPARGTASQLGSRRFAALTFRLRRKGPRRQARQDSNPDQRGWSSRCSRYTTGLKERTTWIEQASPGWRPGALPSELHPQVPRFPGASLRARCRRDSVRPHGPSAGGCAAARGGGQSPTPAREASTPGWSRTSAPAVSEQCSPLSYGREPPAGFEPAPRPYKGRVLPLTLRRLDGDGGSRTHSSSVQARCSATRHPQKARTDGVEPPQPEAPGLQPGELTRAQRPRGRGG